jgi:hypothetical protein
MRGGEVIGLGSKQRILQAGRRVDGAVLSISKDDRPFVCRSCNVPILADCGVRAALRLASPPS